MLTDGLLCYLIYMRFRCVRRVRGTAAPESICSATLDIPLPSMQIHSLPIWGEQGVFFFRLITATTNSTIWASFMFV